MGIHLKTKIVVILLFFVSQSGLLLAESGKALFITSQCKTCHGSKGKKPITPLYPKINNHSKLYIYNQIKAIQSGQRSNGLTTTMRPFTMDLEDEEILVIADYLASVKPSK